MNRKTLPLDPAQAQPASPPASPSPLLDPLGAAAGAMAVYARAAQWLQELELAHLEAVKACSAAFSNATSAGQGATGWDGAGVAWDVLSRDVLAALREDQDRWISAGTALQGDLLKALRERTDELRAQWRPASQAAADGPSAGPFDPVEAIAQARKSFEAWMAQFNALRAPRPVAIA